MRLPWVGQSLRGTRCVLRAFVVRARYVSQTVEHARHRFCR